MTIFLISVAKILVLLSEFDIRKAIDSIRWEYILNLLQ
jgi:hypothetical protein